MARLQRTATQIRRPQNWVVVPGRQLSTDEHRVQKGKQCIDTVGKAQSAERGALFWLRQRPPVTGAAMAELIRRAIDVYLEQRKAEIKNA